jgi:uncharacterized protein involved in cysteine biosynthesis
MWAISPEWFQVIMVIIIVELAVVAIAAVAAAIFLGRMQKGVEKAPGVAQDSENTPMAGQSPLPGRLGPIRGP